MEIEKKKEKVVPITVQIRLATQKGNRLATAMGCIIGTVVPVMVYAITHTLPLLLERGEMIKLAVFSVMGIGGCYFSMKSVIQWGKLAFQSDGKKAIAFALLLEGALVMSGMEESLHWLGYAALAYLAAINAISCGCNIALEAKAHNTDKRPIATVKKKSK